MGRSIGDMLQRAGEREITSVSGTKAEAGDNALIAAPGALWRIVVRAFVVQNATGTATTLLLKAGTAECFRALAQNQGDGLALVFPLLGEWRLPENTALNLNLSGANTCNYSVLYFLERTQ